MRTLIVILLSSIVSAGAFANETPGDQTSHETVWYVSGGALTTLIPGGYGLGHYMVGETKKGNIFLLSQGGLVAGGLLIWLSCPSGRHDVFLDPRCVGTQQNVLNGIGAVFAGLWFYQIYDVWWNGKDYLRKNAEAKVSVGIGPAPGISISYRF